MAVRQLVERAIAIVTPPLHQGTIDYGIGELPTLKGDATLLQQVFNNLLSNAVKFSCLSKAAPGEPCRRAKIEIGALPDQTIFVKDNGVGFAMDYADQLLGTFQRLHSQRQFAGAGIGLSIVQRIMHRHGGMIWAEGKPGQGATFYLKL